VLCASPAVEKILGYPEEEFTQMDAGFILVHPDDIGAVMVMMERIMANSGVQAV
jgi:PAS fold